MGYRASFSSEGQPVDKLVGPLTSPRTFSGVLLKASAAPDTSESFTVTLDSADGDAYDVLVYDQDLVGLTDIAYTGIRLPLEVGDGLRVEYTNTDALNLGISIVLE